MIENCADERAERMAVLLLLFRLLLLRVIYDYGYYSFDPSVFARSSSSNLIAFDCRVEADNVACVLWMMWPLMVDLETNNCDLNVGLVEAMCHSDAAMVVERMVVGQAGVY